MYYYYLAYFSKYIKVKNVIKKENNRRTNRRRDSENQTLCNFSSRTLVL